MSETECTCSVLPEKYHYVYYGATEPGSMWEWDPDCPVHLREWAIADFLRARIDEDERSHPYLGDTGHRRLRAECQAKRQIVTVHHDLLDDPNPFCWTCDDERWPCMTLRALALTYADHPDWREEWRP